MGDTFMAGFVIGILFGAGAVMLHIGKFAETREYVGYTRGYRDGEKTEMDRHKFERTLYTLPELTALSDVHRQRELNEELARNPGLRLAVGKD